MAEKREITEVIDAMLKHVPETETALRAGLKSLHTSAFYKPPEAEAELWRRGAEIMYERFGDGVNKGLDTDWSKHIYNIWMGRSAE